MTILSFEERKLALIRVINEMNDQEKFLQLEAFSQVDYLKNDAFFWEMIGYLDWEKSDNEQIVRPLLQKLSQATLMDIFTFEEQLAQKLFFLDKRIFAQNFDSFSVDIFLYVRACVVANGKDFYEYICQNPQKMPTDLTFESLLYVAKRAYFEKTGRHFLPYAPTVSYETYSNRLGWRSSHAELNVKQTSVC